MNPDIVYAALACLQGLEACRTAVATSLLVCLGAGGDSRVQNGGKQTQESVALPAAVPGQPSAAAAAVAAAPAGKRASTNKRRRTKGAVPAQEQQQRQQQKLQRHEQQQHHKGQHLRRQHLRRQHQQQQREQHQQQQQREQQPAVQGRAPQDPEERVQPAGVGAVEEGAAGQRARPQQTAAPSARSRELYSFWRDDEAQRLVRIVEDAEYRREQLGVGEVEWRAIAAHFHRSEQAVRSKYRSEKIAAEGSGEQPSGSKARVGKRRQAITYGWMAIYALSTQPGQEGTGDEICAAVEAHPPFEPLLDRTARPDSLGVPRWQQRIREELSHRAYFHHTGIKRSGQSVWRLDPSHFDALPANQRRKLKDLRLPGAPLLGRHGEQN